ncbi:hypothetical protein ABT364_04720 [Massilia sp. SR12]
MQHIVGRSAARILLLLPAILLLACGHNHKIAPDDVIQGDGLSARVEHWEYCWQGCSQTEKIYFSERWGEVDEKDYKKHLGIWYDPTPSTLLMLPKSKRFLTTLYSTNDGSVLVEVSKASTLRMIPRAGCMRVDGATLSRLGTSKGHTCVADNYSRHLLHFRLPGIVYPALHVSLHGGFWVDYRDESVHEIALGAPEPNDLLGVGDMDASRQYLLALYKTDVPQHYKVCAFGGGVEKQAPSRYCVEFDSAVPLDTEALRRKFKPTMLPIRNVNAFSATEPVEVSKHHRDWLSQHIVFKAGDSPFSSASGKLPLTISSDNLKNYEASQPNAW